MNKMTNGALAGAAGIVLLLGGAGTFALWNDDADIEGGTITSGVLDIDDSTAGVWTDESYDVTGSPVIDPDTFLVVPGDTLQYEQTFDIAATGNNLLAEVDYTYVAGSLPTGFDVDVVVSVNGATTVASGTPVEVEDGDEVTATLTLTFDAATADQVSQDETVNLSDIGLTLQQVRP